MSEQTVSAELTMAGVWDPEALADPYPLYRRIREASPVFWDARMGDGGAWMVTGYDAVAETLRDHDSYTARRPEWAPDDDAPHSRSLRVMSSQLFARDEPDHERLRKIMIRPFLPRAVDRLRPVIERTCGELLDTVADRGEMELMDDFAMQLPSAILCGVLGIPLSDRAQLWERIISWGLMVDDSPGAREHTGEFLVSVGEYTDYFRDLLAERRAANRNDDLLQQLADAWDGGQFVSEEELLGNLLFLFTAGQATTTHQIGNTVLALLAPENEDVLRQVTADPALVPPATPEFMRYDCSVQLTKRRPLRPVELAGQQVGQGEELFVWMGAANRDPAVFPDPDRLDLSRPRPAHMALGHGPHYCLGGQLGQAVNEVAIQQFVDRIPNPRVDFSQVVRGITPTFRGPFVVPVTFG
jgi:cytochrome P450